jgi:cysteine synthase
VLRRRGVKLPLFSELANPARLSAADVARLRDVDPQAAEPANLFRVADPRNTVLNQFVEMPNHLAHFQITGTALHSVYRQLRSVHPDWRLRWFVAGSGSAGTLGAGDHLKDTYGCRIAVVEPLECPTLTRNGFGDHNIQGIGDKHVPLIHNVMNTDAVIAVSDRCSDELGLVFDTPAGRDLLAARGVSADVLADLAHVGLSGLANVVAAIRLARHFDLDEDDVIVTLATDGSGMYASERRKLLDERFGGLFDETRAAAAIDRHLDDIRDVEVQETTAADRQRMFNLGYYTWVEQQGVTLDIFEARRNQSFWRASRTCLQAWDELISEFNHLTGLDGD